MSRYSLGEVLQSASDRDDNPIRRSWFHKEPSDRENDKNQQQARAPELEPPPLEIPLRIPITFEQRCRLFGSHQIDLTLTRHSGFC